MIQAVLQTTVESDTLSTVEINGILEDKVDKITGKRLSTNDFTNELLNKLNAVDETAEPNVQSDWNQENDTQDDYIKNKPSIPSLTNYYNKSETDNLLIDKVDKEAGKGLSSNDYTAEEKTSVATIADKADADTVYTKSETDDLLDDKTNKSTKVSFTLAAADWNNTTNTVSLVGVTNTNVIDVSVATTITSAQLNALLRAIIVGTSQSTNSITLIAFGEVPTIDIPLVAVIRRDL